MNNLYTLVIVYLQEYSLTYLDLFSILSVLCAILVIITKNPIASILFLICLFVLVSGYLLLLGMNFIGLSYLLVYIGAVSILFLFILMLINIRISEIQTETINSLPLSIIISVSVYSVFYDLIPFNIDINSFYSSQWKPYDLSLRSFFDSFNVWNNHNIHYLSSIQWDSNIIETLHITAIGNILYTSYFLWLIVASIILLLAMVGTIVITMKQ